MNKKEIKYVVDKYGCHNCTSHTKGTSGYHVITQHGIQILIHRLIYTQHFGEIPDGMVIRHKCDNRGCINPKHLELGTHADNVQDRVDRNRSAKGEGNGRSKLKNEDVIRIRYDITHTNSDLAKQYGVDSAVIRRIKNGTSWKSVI